jgi:hypothetical protein
MTIGELAALFNVGYEAMKAYCRRNQIPHKWGGIKCLIQTFIWVITNPTAWETVVT